MWTIALIIGGVALLFLAMCWRGETTTPNDWFPLLKRYRADHRESRKKAS